MENHVRICLISVSSFSGTYDLIIIILLISHLKHSRLIDDVIDYIHIDYLIPTASFTLKLDLKI